MSWRYDPQGRGALARGPDALRELADCLALRKDAPRCADRYARACLRASWRASPRKQAAMSLDDKMIRISDSLRNVRYEIRGKLARRALEMSRKGYEIISLNIGNPALFGFRTPETMRLAMIENFPESEGYCHQKGIFPAREAVVMQQQARGVTGVSAEEVFIGNGVSELIDLTLRALLNDGDEVLVPSPDYPLWTAAVNLNRGKAVHYPCRPENGFVPDPAELAALVTPRTRAIVIVNPNNPTGAVYPRAVLEPIAQLAERRGLVLLCDEIYDQITYKPITAPSSCRWLLWFKTRSA